MLLLHLSDIHFRFDEIDTQMDPNKHLRNELLLDAQTMCRQIGKSPSAILITGDIAFSARPEEYEFALKWLESLAKNCGCETENIFIVPGNHDVSRNLASKPMVKALHQQIKEEKPFFLEATLRGHLSDKDSGRFLYGPLNNYNLFAGQFFCDVSPPDRTFAVRNLTLNDGSILKLIGLNSALISSEADRKGTLCIDPAALQITRERGVEYVVLCHHPFGWMKNGDDLQSHLNDIAKLQLFGHEHNNRIELNRDWVRISASAAHPERTEHGWEPGYNLIELCVNSIGEARNLTVTTHVRVWQLNPSQFRPKMDKSKTEFVQNIPLESWKYSPALVNVSAEVDQAPETAIGSQPMAGDPMDTVRGISRRFYKLTFSQKSAIAGKLGLLEDEDINQPDYERFRNVFLRAQERGLVKELDLAIKEMTESN